LEVGNDGTTGPAARIANVTIADARGQVTA